MPRDDDSTPNQHRVAYQVSMPQDPDSPTAAIRVPQSVLRSGKP